MLLDIVTDDELLTSQVVKFILMVILTVALVWNAVGLFRTSTIVRRLLNLFLLVFFGAAFFIVFQQFIVDRAMFQAAEYVQGTTKGYCNVFAKGKGIAFEYQVEGKTYKGCSIFYPMKEDSIQVPGGRYKVRYSKQFAARGRMIFKND